MSRHAARVRGFLPCLVAAAAVVGATVQAAAQGPQAITIDSNLAVKQRPYSPIVRAKAFASVVLLAGGNGVLDLNASGDIRGLQGNFLIRSARRFLNARLNVAMLDAEPAFPGPGGLDNQRLTQAHADHMANVIAAVRNRWPGKPVWLVGTSNGALSALNAAARLIGSVGPDGIALTSGITQGDTAGETGHLLGASPGLANVAVPTLVMWHKGDSCFASPAAGAVAVYNGLTNVPATRKAKEVISGGSPGVAVPGCSAFHYHGYNRVEQSAVSIIVRFINKHGP